MGWFPYEEKGKTRTVTKVSLPKKTKTVPTKEQHKVKGGREQSRGWGKKSVRQDLAVWREKGRRAKSGPGKKRGKA